MAEVPSAGDSQHQSTPPGNGAPGTGPGRPEGPEGPDRPEGPEGPDRPEDDWDQEASLAAFVAEEEAKRAHGLIDIDDYYDLDDPDDGYDLPDDYCGPDRRRVCCRTAGAGVSGPAPATWPPGLLPDGRSRMRDFSPGARMAAGMMVVLIATAVRGSLRAECGTRRCQGQAWLRLLTRPPVPPGAMGTPVTMS